MAISLLAKQPKANHVFYLLENSNDAILEVDLERNIVGWNPAAEKLYGYKKREILGKAADILIPENKRKEILEAFKRLAKGYPVRNFETERIRKDGKIINVSLTISPIRDDKGKIIGHLTIYRDVTKHRKLEEKLKAFAKAMDEAPDGIQIVDSSGKITYSNKAVERIYGFKPRELRGKHVNTMNADPKFASLVIIPAIKKFGRWEGELIVKKKGGGTFPIWLTTSLVKNAKGKPLAMVGVIRDITERKKLDELKTEFLSAAAHELKTPITTLKLIVGSHISKHKKLGKDKINLSELVLIDQELNRLNLLINDLLDDARIESGKFSMHFETVNLKGLIFNVIKKMRIISRRHRIIFHRSPSINVVADRNRIEQVLINLISNAMKYSRDGSKIEIGLGEDKNRAKVYVKDYGEGIPKEKIPLIFDRFYQVKEYRARGFGLGLYISRQIINAHKGKIWVKSKPSHGSTFYFTLRKSTNLIP